MWIVDTLGPDGEPWCPVCHEPVEREGHFCTPGCWNHFHTTVYDLGKVIEMNYLDLEEQPWYSKHHG